MVPYVINTIIKKTETSKVDWRPEAGGNRSFPLEEYHRTDYKTVSRSDFAAQVRDLEQKGLLTCRWTTGFFSYIGGTG